MQPSNILTKFVQLLSAFMLILSLSAYLVWEKRARSKHSSSPEELQDKIMQHMMNKNRRQKSSFGSESLGK
jgi:hypothetical protein